MKNIKIQSNKPIYGEIELSGDPIDSIVLATFAIFSKVPVEIKNVPRCIKVLKYFELLRAIKVDVEWINSDTVRVFVKEQLEIDLSGLINPDNHLEIGLMIPALLFRSKECILTSSMRGELKFYREMGIEVNTSYNRYHLKLPLSNSAVSQKRINLNKSHDLLLASRLFFQRIYPSLSVVYQETSSLLSCLDFQISPEVEKSYLVGHNKLEFRMFVAAAIVSKGEISLSSFNLADSLEYLLELEKIGCSYEVTKNKIKIWYETKKLSQFYDFSGHEFSEIGYFALILSLFSKNTTQILCVSDEIIENIVKDLNIIGCRIDSQSQADYKVLNIKPRITIAIFKTEVVSANLAGILFAAALSVKGTSIIRNFDILEDYVNFISEKFKKLHIDVTFG